MDGPTAASHSLFHSRHPERAGAIQPLVQASSGLELAINLQHQSLAGQIIKTVLLIADGVVVGERFGNNHLHSQAIGKAFRQSKKVTEHPQATPGLVRKQAGLHGTQLFQLVPALGREVVYRPCFGHVNRKARGRRITDDAEGQLHLVKLGISQFSKKDNISIIWPGSYLDPDKTQPLRRDYLHQPFSSRIAERGRIKLQCFSQTFGKQGRVERLFFRNIQPVDGSQRGERLTVTAEQGAVSR